MLTSALFTLHTAAQLALGSLGAAPATVPQHDTPAQGTPWCAPELKALEGDVCYHAGPLKKDDEPRVLVIFLHGLVQVGADWQHHQQRAIVRGAKRNGFGVLAPKGIDDGSDKYPGMVAWPTSMKAQKQHEAAVLAQWTHARAALAEADDRYDQVYVVGFSNGAYYGTSLATRGAFEADGYAVFAGGSYWGSATKRRPPIFVGVCSRDGTTVDRARDLVRALKRAKWPHRAETRKVGHTMTDAHLDHAIAYLREAAGED